MKRAFVLLAALLFFMFSTGSYADTFNGAGDYQTDTYGYYYAVGGGLFPNGQTRNGDNASGGTLRFLTDDPVWGGYTLGTWHKDDWYPVTSSIALTLKIGSSVVFDNNGIETGNVPAGYWNSTSSPGSQVVGYSMSNNFDWIYAGYFHLSEAITIDSITGYFIVPQAAFVNDVNNFAGPFDPNNPNLKYHTEIFSEVTGQLPANTGSFAGDVFSSSNVAGTYSWSPTGYVRQTVWTADIYRLEYKLDTPVVLAAGDYYFNHNASIAPVPLPSSVSAGIVLLGVLFAVNRFKRLRGAQKQVA